VDQRRVEPLTSPVRGGAVGDKKRSMTEPIEELFGQHRRELLVHYYRMMGSYPESEDVVQETFIRARRSYERIEGRSAVRAS
jgi:RNA polymerase sigma-70 factor, ECF subfamily